MIVLDQGDNNAAKDMGIDDFSNYVATRMRLDLVTLEGMVAPADNLVFADASLGGFPRPRDLGRRGRAHSRSGHAHYLQRDHADQ